MKSTNTYDYSNKNFLPNHEYQLFRMVKTVDIIDPQGLLPQTPESPNVLIFQGTQSDNPLHTSGSQVENKVGFDYLKFDVYINP